MTRQLLRWITLFTAITILITVLFFTRRLIAEQADRPAAIPAIHSKRPDVRVVTVSGAEYNAMIRGYGETQTHFSLTLTAQTSGQVVWQSEKLEPGCKVNKGEVLIHLEESDYTSAVADAKSTLASARLALLEEQREASQAQTEWQASGFTGEPDSELVLHQPQLAAAEAAVTKAEAAVASAAKNLSRTQITAPFDAIIVERLTSPGSYLQAGTEIATLYSTDMIELSIPLAARDWSNLPDPATLSADSWPVQLTGVENNHTWTGRVLRAEQHIDSATRQRTLRIAVDSPLEQVPQLLPGTFVEARITGSSVSDVWELPSSALSQRGEVWYVTENNTLARFTTTPVFSNGNAIYVKFPSELSTTPIRVVVHPLSSYLPGMLVQPVMEDTNA
jgi:RND family efflux transporter MFP subunit